MIHLQLLKSQVAVSVAYLSSWSRSQHQLGWEDDIVSLHQWWVGTPTDSSQSCVLPPPDPAFSVQDLLRGNVCRHPSIEGKCNCLKAALAMAHRMHLLFILDQYFMYLDSTVRLVGWSPCLCCLCFLTPTPSSAIIIYWKQQLPGITSQHLTSSSVVQFVRTVYFQFFSSQSWPFLLGLVVEDYFISLSGLSPHLTLYQAFDFQHFLYFW